MAGSAAATTFDEVDARRHHVVTGDAHVVRRVCKAAFFLLASALVAQKLTTHLTAAQVSQNNTGENEF